MSRYEKIMQRIRAAERILIDGATGTEVERRGVPQLENAWNGGGALTHPDIVRQVHEDYIRQGAECVISNTFANTRHAMRDAGMEDAFEIVNQRGVELAVEARSRMQTPDVLVAGGVSYCTWTGNHPSFEELHKSVVTQAAIMAGAGADLLMLEMMIDIDRMLITLEAAQTSGLPVWVGLTCEPNREGIICLRNGETLVNALAAIQGKNVPLVSIMHTEVEYIDACLDVALGYWSDAIGVYAHSGHYDESTSKWVFNDTISPQDYAVISQRWLARGVAVIGGCCGIGADHIAALAKVV